MKKRVIAFIGAVAMIFALALPCFAAESYDYTDEFIFAGFYDPSYSGRLILALRGDIKVTVTTSDGTSFVYFFRDFFLYPCYGYYDVYSSGVALVDSDGYYSYSSFDFFESFHCESSNCVYLCDTGGYVLHFLYLGQDSVSISYNKENVLFADPLCTNYGFTCVGEVLTQEDVDNARQEGYSEGFTAGAESIDQDAIRQEGYNQGYDVGYAEGDALGQKIGFNDGYLEAIYEYGERSGGVFEYLVLDLLVYHDFDGDGVETVDRLEKVPFDKTLGGIYFDSTLSYLINKYGTDEFTRVDLILKFDSGTYIGQDPIDWSASPIFISGSSLVESAKIKTVNGDEYILSANDGSADTMRSFSFTNIDEVSFPVIVNTFTLMVGRPGDLLHEISLWSESELYSYGYVSGYADGLSSDSTESYNTGYNSGYGTGYLEGKNEGLNLGKSGDWKSLMTAVVEAPINTFQSLFNFEVLGLDMRAAFGSVLAVCVILIIIKKVIL